MLWVVWYPNFKQPFLSTFSLQAKQKYEKLLTQCANLTAMIDVCCSEFGSTAKPDTKASNLQMFFLQVRGRKPNCVCGASGVGNPQALVALGKRDKGRD